MFTTHVCCTRIFEFGLNRLFRCMRIRYRIFISNSVSHSHIFITRRLSRGHIILVLYTLTLAVSFKRVSLTSSFNSCMR
ncbi:hypothetical protein BDZ91DRAFT_24852 [Kalaharituber pfeilii]|nr:hypothetical protein BDZ91DRAFT_24852 [Kalaharituber pfeilii]